MDSRAHFLIVGDATDLPMLRGILSRLPADAYGQVFVEVATAVQIQDWEAPADVSVTWLVRERLRHPLPPRGDLATEAVIAWIAEWMPEEQGLHAVPYVLWIGCSMNPQMDRLYRELDERLDGVHLHHPHHD